MQLSLAEENYLKSIYHLSDGTESGVSTNAIAEELQTKPASVSDMIRKLSGKKLVKYQKYKGVEVSKEGKVVALNIIRKHRLWEVFLMEKLDFSWDEVHDIAEQLEHIKSPLLIQKLDKFLGFPSVDPHGDPIPDENGEIKIVPQRALCEMQPSESGTVVNVPDNNPALLRHLDIIKMKLGSKILVKERVEFDGSVLATIDDQAPIYLSAEIAKKVMLKKA